MSFLPEGTQITFVWDKHAIKAALYRKGQTLSGLAKESGLSEGSLSVALNTRFPAGERAISDFLQVPLHELWPDRYTPQEFETSKASTLKQGALSPEEADRRNKILVSGEKAA